MRALLAFALAACAIPWALAQNPTLAAGDPPPPTQINTETGQRTQRIVVEDAGSRVDELRVGGQTKSITVQPKVGSTLPSYEVRPSDGARLWNLGRF